MYMKCWVVRKGNYIHAHAMGAIGRDLSVVYQQDHYLGLFAACFQASLVPLNCH